MGPRPVLIKRRLACENTRFSVFLDDIGSQGRVQVENYLVVAPKLLTGNLIAGVAVLPVIDEKMGLLRIYRHALQCSLWEIPRGFIETGESVRNSALRELEEETGLTCPDSDLESLGIVAPEPGVLAARAHLFIARRCRKLREFAAEEFGHTEFRWFTQSQVSALHDAGEIQDSTTLIAYLLYGGRLAR